MKSGAKRKGPTSQWRLDALARPAGFELTTPWFVARRSRTVSTLRGHAARTEFHVSTQSFMATGR